MLDLYKIIIYRGSVDLISRYHLFLDSISLLFGPLLDHFVLKSNKYRVVERRGQISFHLFIIKKNPYHMSLRQTKIKGKWRVGIFIQGIVQFTVE